MTTENEILQYLSLHPQSSRADITKALSSAPSDSTVKRIIARAVRKGLIGSSGRGPSIRYSACAQALLTREVDLDSYFSEETDQRTVREGFNHELIRDLLPSTILFTHAENGELEATQARFRENLKDMPQELYRKEMERLGVDLSWKSSQIEGNTYSLLETERLLREKTTASGKTKEEAIMLLNHKDALDFILDNPDYLKEVSVHKIEDLHSILTKELGVERNIRRRRIGITGTNYKPLDNQFQILEAMEDSCALINGKEDVFEKAFLALILISYIQPFTDGNKRTARIAANAILIANGYCPISFRSVDSIDYKKAMLLFYEQNNISAFKKIFIEQFLFAVRTYF